MPTLTERSIEIKSTLTCCESAQPLRILYMFQGSSHYQTAISVTLGLLAGNGGPPRTGRRRSPQQIAVSCVRCDHCCCGGGRQRPRLDYLLVGMDVVDCIGLACQFILQGSKGLLICRVCDEGWLVWLRQGPCRGDDLIRVKRKQPT